jgi:hypothetical protein
VLTLYQPNILDQRTRNRWPIKCQQCPKCQRVKSGSKGKLPSRLVASLATLERRRPDHLEGADWQHAVEDGRRFLCNESNNHVQIGKENYFMSADGYLMPAKKDQPPPDLRYFKQTQK